MIIYCIYKTSINLVIIIIFMHFIDHQLLSIIVLLALLRKCISKKLSLTKHVCTPVHVILHTEVFLNSFLTKSLRQILKVDFQLRLHTKGHSLATS